ncbi:uncharacterized protein ACN427_013500 isoform 1-T2 [Glossina fuscipes fuscipes]
MQSPSKEATDTSRKEPIHIPREPSKVEETENDIEQIKETKVKAAPPPDLIPSIEMQTVVTPPSEVQSPEPPERVHIKTEHTQREEPLYQNQEEI